MNATAEEREKIYLEEKARREGNAGGSSLLMLGFVIGGIVGLAALFSISCKLSERKVNIEDLRRAYAGLSPDEEEQE